MGKGNAVNYDRNILRICAAVILCAVLFRALDALNTYHADAAATLLFLETGRIAQPTEPSAPETVPTIAATEPAVSFAAEDAAAIAVNNFADVTPDMEALLLQPLQWDLTGQTPAVLILHTHASESYLNTENYPESGDFRTLDEQYNVISIGAYVAQLLSRQGIAVVHDKTLHDYPSYNGSYENARQTIAAYLEKYPSIQLVLDIHRDAMADSSGNQLGYTVSTEQGTAAQVMLVVGCNNEDWEKNAALAAKLHAQLENMCSGICRPLVFRQSRFNQDLSAGAVLIELGATGNTRQEALLAADYVARAIIALAHGTT